MSDAVILEPVIALPPMPSERRRALPLDASSKLHRIDFLATSA